jgi:hypothetical protein
MQNSGFGMSCCICRGARGLDRLDEHVFQNKNIIVVAKSLLHWNGKGFDDHCALVTVVVDANAKQSLSSLVPVLPAYSMRSFATGQLVCRVGGDLRCSPNHPCCCPGDQIQARRSNTFPKLKAMKAKAWWQCLHPHSLSYHTAPCIGQ